MATAISAITRMPCSFERPRKLKPEMDVAVTSRSAESRPAYAQRRQQSADEARQDGDAEREGEDGQSIVTSSSLGSSAPH